MRKAYLKFKNLKTEKFYCRYGKNHKDKPTACNPVPADIASLPHCGTTVTASCSTEDDRNIYNPSVLTKCVCTGGTDCKAVLANAGVASVGSTIFVRVALGTLLERFGPVNVQSSLLTFGAIWVFAAAGITAPWNYTMIRFFIGCAGATFVTNQFWCSLMFAPNIVGTANATAAGWGNLGGGVTQIFIVWALVKPMRAAGVNDDTAWRCSMIVPGIIFVLIATGLKLLCQDTPTKLRFEPSDTGKSSASMR